MNFQIEYDNCVIDGPGFAKAMNMLLVDGLSTPDNPMPISPDRQWGALKMAQDMALMAAQNKMGGGIQSITTDSGVHAVDVLWRPDFTKEQASYDFLCKDTDCESMRQHRTCVNTKISVPFCIENCETDNYDPQNARYVDVEVEPGTGKTIRIPIAFVQTLESAIVGLIDKVNEFAIESLDASIGINVSTGDTVPVPVPVLTTAGAPNPQGQTKLNRIKTDNGFGRYAVVGSGNFMDYDTLSGWTSTSGGGVAGVIPQFAKSYYTFYNDASADDVFGPNNFIMVNSGMFQFLFLTENATPTWKSGNFDINNPFSLSTLSPSFKSGSFKGESYAFSVPLTKWIKGLAADVVITAERCANGEFNCYRYKGYVYLKVGVFRAPLNLYRIQDKYSGSTGVVVGNAIIA